MREGEEEKSRLVDRDRLRVEERRGIRPSAGVLASRMMGTLPRCLRAEEVAAARRRCEIGVGESRPKVLSMSKSTAGLVWLSCDFVKLIRAAKWSAASYGALGFLAPSSCSWTSWPVMSVLFWRTMSTSSDVQEQ